MKEYQNLKKKQSDCNMKKAQIPWMLAPGKSPTNKLTSGEISGTSQESLRNIAGISPMRKLCLKPKR